jgi:hypothetical protein
MTLTSIFRVKHLEPPPRLYALMAQGSLMRRIYRGFVADLAEGLSPGTRLLDVGTGPGYLLGYLARARPDLSLWGLDFSYGMISRAQPFLRPRRRPAGWWPTPATCPFPPPRLATSSPPSASMSGRARWPDCRNYGGSSSPAAGPGSMNCAGRPLPGICKPSPGKPDCPCPWSIWGFKP